MIISLQIMRSVIIQSLVFSSATGLKNVVGVWQGQLWLVVSHLSRARDSQLLHHGGQLLHHVRPDLSLSCATLDPDHLQARRAAATMIGSGTRSMAQRSAIPFLTS